jgi:hypothetical protein
MTKSDENHAGWTVFSFGTLMGRRAPLAPPRRSPFLFFERFLLLSLHRAMLDPWPWYLVGCDSDALDVIRGGWPGFVEHVEVHDCPMKVEMVKGTLRSRQDTVAMVKLVRELGTPAGTIVHLEEKAGTPASRPKRRTCREPIAVSGWEGILVPLDLDVRQVPACTWKHALKLAGKATTEMGTIELARTVFPEAAAKLLTLTLEEHPGRAEALLIAAHGQWAPLVGEIGTCRYV